MRKITLLFVALCLATSLFAQLMPIENIENSFNQYVNKKHVNSIRNQTVHWQATFSEEPETWVVGSNPGMPEWHVSDLAGAPQSWKTNEGLYHFYYLGEAYPDAGKWAWIDLFTDYTSQVPNGSTWIRFDNIDLSASSHPKLIFTQLHKAVNSFLFSLYVDISVDGGTTWTSIEVNKNVDKYEYADQEFIQIPLDPEVFGNQPNVSLSFRWENHKTSMGEQFAAYPVAYGWQIDDVKIVENPDVDMVLNSIHTNFFEYKDYHSAGNSENFHLSSYYGSIPEEQISAADANITFSAIVRNRGNNTINPKLKVRVFNPADEEIYSEISEGSALNLFDIDTLDLLSGFSFDKTPERGRYKIIYSIENENDGYLADNADTSYFNVTDNVYARDFGEMTEKLGPADFLFGGVNGDMIATDYLFQYNTRCKSVDVFINEKTTVGTGFKLHLFWYNRETKAWNEMLETPLVTVTDEMLGHWNTCLLPDDVYIMSIDGGRKIKVALELQNVNGGENLFVGADPTVPAGVLGVSWFFMGGPQPREWLNVEYIGGLGLRLNTIENSDSVETQVNIFPNPVTETLHIETTENNFNIELYNINGQLILQAKNNTRLSVANLPNGVYILKLITEKDTYSRKVVKSL